jgi:hypothetical protein
MVVVEFWVTAKVPGSGRSFTVKIGSWIETEVLAVSNIFPSTVTWVIRLAVPTVSISVSVIVVTHCPEPLIVPE